MAASSPSATENPGEVVTGHPVRFVHSWCRKELQEAEAGGQAPAPWLLALLELSRPSGTEKAFTLSVILCSDSGKVRWCPSVSVE